MGESVSVLGRTAGNPLSLWMVPHSSVYGQSKVDSMFYCFVLFLFLEEDVRLGGVGRWQNRRGKSEEQI